MLRVGYVEVTKFLFVVESLRLTLTVLGKEALEEEAYQLSFESVRHARCSWPEDEVHIRAEVRGIEDSIDEAIRTLKIIGRYDSVVLSNLDRGLSKSRTRQGVSLLRLTIICTYWAALPISSAERFSSDMQAGRFQGLLAGLLAIVVMVLAVGVTFVAGDHATFFIDALFWAGTCGWQVCILFEIPAVPGIVRDTKRLEIMFACLLAVLLVCQLFYSGVLGHLVCGTRAKRLGMQSASNLGKLKNKGSM